MKKNFKNKLVGCMVLTTLVGILAGIAGLLAENGISIFAVSTFNTDYILVKNVVCKNREPDKKTLKNLKRLQFAKKRRHPRV